MVQSIHALDTPALLVDLDRLERNIAHMASLAASHDKRLRPHVKTHKTIEIARMQMAGGACGITVAKLAEAEVMVDAGITDVFVANQVVGDARLARLAVLARMGRMTVGVDSPAVLEPLQAHAKTHGYTAHVAIEIDTGHHRAGVRSPTEAANLAAACCREKSTPLVGLFTHEGHVYAARPDARRRLLDAVVDQMLLCADAVRRLGLPAPCISVGSTPGASHLASAGGVTELRPGNYVFGDGTQVHLGMDADQCALSVLATVTGRPSVAAALVDAGSKALSGDTRQALGYGALLDDPTAFVDWCSEEHGHVHLGLASIRPCVGDRLRIVPTHACTCVNMHDRMWVVRGDSIVDCWPIAARGRMH